MHQTDALCETVLSLQRDLRLTIEQAALIRREMGSLVAASRTNAQLFSSLSRVQHELDCLKRAVIDYEQTAGTPRNETARLNMFGLAKYERWPS